MASVPAMRVSGDARMRSWASWWASLGGWLRLAAVVASVGAPAAFAALLVLLPGLLLPFRGRRGLRAAAVV